MISPAEIKEKEFGRGLKGYRDDEVDDFLNRIIIDLEQILDENHQLKVEQQGMADELKRYRGEESTVMKTLQTAKDLMTEIAAGSEKRAELLMQNAEMDAQLLQKEAKEAVKRLREENRTLHERVTELRKRYKQLLESELKRFDSLTSELFPEFMDSDEQGPKEPVDEADLEPFVKNADIEKSAPAEKKIPTEKSAPVKKSIPEEKTSPPENVPSLDIPEPQRPSPEPEIRSEEVEDLSKMAEEFKWTTVHQK